MQAVSLKAADTVVVSGAAGGVGSIAVQLARNVGELTPVGNMTVGTRSISIMLS